MKLNKVIPATDKLDIVSTSSELSISRKSQVIDKKSFEFLDENRKKLLQLDALKSHRILLFKNASSADGRRPRILATKQMGRLELVSMTNLVVNSDYVNSVSIQIRPGGQGGLPATLLWTETDKVIIYDRYHGDLPAGSYPGMQSSFKNSYFQTDIRPAGVRSISAQVVKFSLQMPNALGWQNVDNVRGDKIAYAAISDNNSNLRQDFPLRNDTIQISFHVSSTSGDSYFVDSDELMKHRGTIADIAPSAKLVHNTGTLKIREETILPAVPRLRIYDSSDLFGFGKIEKNEELFISKALLSDKLIKLADLPEESSLSQIFDKIFAEIKSRVVEATGRRRDDFMLITSNSRSLSSLDLPETGSFAEHVSAKLGGLDETKILRAYSVLMLFQKTTKLEKRDIIEMMSYGGTEIMTKEIVDLRSGNALQMTIATGKGPGKGLAYVAGRNAGLEITICVSGGQGDEQFIYTSEWSDLEENTDLYKIRDMSSENVLTTPVVMETKTSPGPDYSARNLKESQRHKYPPVFSDADSELTGITSAIDGNGLLVETDVIYSAELDANYPD